MQDLDTETLLEQVKELSEGLPGRSLTRGAGTGEAGARGGDNRGVQMLSVAFCEAGEATAKCIGDYALVVEQSYGVPVFESGCIVRIC